GERAVAGSRWTEGVRHMTGRGCDFRLIRKPVAVELLCVPGLEQHARGERRRPLCLHDVLGRLTLLHGGSGRDVRRQPPMTAHLVCPVEEHSETVLRRELGSQPRWKSFHLAIVDCPTAIW